jgi:hypothetical protein
MIIVNRFRKKPMVSDVTKKAQKLVKLKGGIVRPKKTVDGE